MRRGDIVLKLIIGKHVNSILYEVELQFTDELMNLKLKKLNFEKLLEFNINYGRKLAKIILPIF
jgi:hypothetical protein